MPPQILGEVTQPGSSVRNILFLRSSLISSRQGDALPTGYSLFLEGSVGSQCELRTQDHTPKMQESSPAAAMQSRRPPPHAQAWPSGSPPDTSRPRPHHAFPAGDIQAHRWLWREASMDLGWCPDGGRQVERGGKQPQRTDGPLQSPRALSLCADRPARPLGPRHDTQTHCGSCRCCQPPPLPGHTEGTRPFLTASGKESRAGGERRQGEDRGRRCGRTGRRPEGRGRGSH